MDSIQNFNIIAFLSMLGYLTMYEDLETNLQLLRIFSLSLLFQSNDGIYENNNINEYKRKHKLKHRAKNKQFTSDLINQTEIVKKKILCHNDLAFI